MAEAAVAIADPDAAKYAALEKEVKDWADEPEEKAPAEQAEPEPKAANDDKQLPEAEKKEPDAKPKPYEELERNYKNVQGALGEARGESRQLREQMEKQGRQLQALQEFLRSREQQQDEQFLTPEEKLARSVQYLDRQNRELAERQAQFEQQSAQERELQSLGARAMREEQEFSTKQPDYLEAANHLHRARMTEIELFLPDHSPQAQAAAQRAGFKSVAELRAQTIRNEQINLARTAHENGMSAAEVIYRMAQTRGYQPKQAAPAVKQPAPIEAVKAGSKAANSLSGGGSSSTPENDTSIEDLAQMFIDDPEKAEVVWAKMKKQGRLG